MNTSALLSLVSLSLLAATATSQDAPPKPAPELARLKAFEGHWEGSGTAMMGPGTEPTKWTSKSTYQWALSGFFLQADSSIQFEGGGPALRFREYLGWDGENKRYVDVSVSNSGEGVVSTLMFPSDDTMVSMTRYLRDGKTQIERAFVKFAKDEQRMTLSFLNEAGPSVDAIIGTFKRVQKTTPTGLEAVHGMGPAPAAMGTIAKMAGEYDFVGEMTMMPGTPAMKIKGRDSVRSLFEGAIVQVVTHGEPVGPFPAYEAHAYYAWNPCDKCYDIVMVSNMGEAGTMQTRLEGDKLVGVFAGLSMGKNSAAHMVMSLDKDGRPTKSVAHAILGASEPYKSFEASYTKVK